MAISIEVSALAAAHLNAASLRVGSTLRAADKLIYYSVAARKWVWLDIFSPTKSIVNILRLLKLKDAEREIVGARRKIHLLFTAASQPGHSLRQWQTKEFNHAFRNGLSAGVGFARDFRMRRWWIEFGDDDHNPTNGANSDRSYSGKRGNRRGREHGSHRNLQPGYERNLDKFFDVYRVGARRSSRWDRYLRRQRIDRDIYAVNESGVWHALHSHHHNRRRGFIGHGVGCKLCVDIYYGRRSSCANGHSQ